MLNQLKLSSKVSAWLITRNSPYTFCLMLICQPAFFAPCNSIFSGLSGRLGRPLAERSEKLRLHSPFSIKFLPSKLKSRQIYFKLSLYKSKIPDEKHLQAMLMNSSYVLSAMKLISRHTLWKVLFIKTIIAH